MINHSRAVANSSSEVLPFTQNSAFILIQLGISTAASPSGASAYGIVIISCCTRYSITWTNPASSIWSDIQNSATCLIQPGIFVLDLGVSATCGGFIVPIVIVVWAVCDESLAVIV